MITTPGSSTATVSAFIKAGFKYDPINKPGLAHFTEHMLFNGTKNYPSPTKLAWEIEKHGGWQHALTWIEHQQHLIHLPKDNFKDGIKILLDKLTNSLLEQNELEREKGMVKEEILRNRSDPEKAIVDYSWQPLFFKGTNIARPYSGLEDDVEQFMVSDVQKFIKQNFLAPSTVFLISGDFDFDEAVNIFEEYTESYNKMADSVIVPLVTDNSSRVNIFQNNADQASVIMGIKTVPYGAKERHILNFIKNILGGFYGARLPQRLRDEGGLVYYCHFLQDNLMDNGYFIFRTSTAPKNVYKLVEVVLSEFRRLTEERIGLEELKVAKGYSAGSLLCNTQTGFDFINWYGLQELLTHEVISLEEQAKIYRKISVEEILEVGRKYFNPDNIYLAILGNVEEDKIHNIMRG